MLFGQVPTSGSPARRQSDYGTMQAEETLAEEQLLCLKQFEQMGRLECASAPTAHVIPETPCAATISWR